MKFEPMGDRVLVEPLKPESVKLGIVVPDVATEKHNEGVVVAVGPGRRADTGVVIKPCVQPGDRVLVSTYGGTDVKIDNKTYRLVPAGDILAVLKS